MQIVYTADNNAEAHMMAHMLEREGLFAQVQGSFLSGAAGEIPVSNLIKIMVPDEEAEEARKIIKQWESITNKKETPKNKANLTVKSSSFPEGILLGIIIGFALSAIYFHAPYSDYELDNNMDGITDQRFIYTASGNLKKTTIDVNFDGKDDEISFFDKWTVLKETVKDSDFDGTFETKMHYNYGNLVKKTIDDNNDSHPDRIFKYDKHSTLIHSEQYHEEKATLVTKTYFENAKPTYAHQDTNHDGTLDTEIKYDIYGRITSREPI